MPQESQLSKPLLNTNVFEVSVPGLTTIGYFSQCSGLEVHFDVYEYREGGRNDYVHRLPGQLHYPNLVLTHGMTSEKSLFEWFQRTQHKADRKEMTLTLGRGDATRSWTFADAFPVRWSGPQLAAGSGIVANEILEIAHGGPKQAA